MKISILSAGKEGLFRQFLLFCIIGGISTIFNYLLFAILVMWGMNYLLSSALGYFLGVFISFRLNKKFTFNIRSNYLMGELSKYLKLYSFSLILGLIFLRSLVYIGINVYIANIFMISLTTTINFIGTKIFVFENQKYQKHVSFIIYRYRYVYRYILIGLGSLIIEAIFIEILKETFNSLNIPIIIFYISGFVIGMLFAFYFNIKMNFPVPKKENIRIFKLFVLISSFSFLLNLILIQILFPRLQFLSYYGARIIVAGTLFIFIYSLHRKFTFSYVKDVGLAIYASREEDLESIKSKIEFFPDFIHIDLVDETFDSSGLPDLETVKKIHTEWPYTMKMLHIMSKYPTRWIENTYKYTDYIIFHSEIEEDIFEIIDVIKKFGRKVGISILYNTDIKNIEEYLPNIQIVQVLGIPKPGQSGQLLESIALEKVNELKKLKEKYNFEICFDGGIKLTNIHNIDAKYIVSASTILSSNNPVKTIFDLKTNSRYYVHGDKDLRQFLLTEIEKIIISCDFIKSGSLVGSFTKTDSIEGIGDIDIVVIVDKLNKNKFDTIVTRFQDLEPIIKANYDHNMVINTTFGPLKFNKNKTVVFHLMVYDVEGHIKHCIKSPFTCMDWQNSKIFFKSPMSCIYDVTILQPGDFFNARRSVKEYLNDLSQSVITYREYDFDRDEVKEIKKEKTMTNKDHFDFAYHIMKFSMSNFIKLYYKEKYQQDSGKTIETYFYIYPKNKNEYVKYLDYLRNLKETGIYPQWKEANKKLIYNYLNDFQDQFQQMFYEDSIKIFFFRHYKTEINQSGIFLGSRLDPEIIVPEMQEIEIIKDFIQDKTIHKIYSSPMRRCLQTANIFSDLSKSDQIILDKNLIEIDYGEMDGKTYKDLKKLYPYMIYAWSNKEDPRFPKGENTEDVVRRLNQFLSSIKNNRNWNEGQNYIVCTHNVFLRCLIGTFFKIPIDRWYLIEINYLEPIEMILIKKGIYYINLTEEQKEHMLRNIQWSCING